MEWNGTREINGSFNGATSPESSVFDSSQEKDRALCGCGVSGAGDWETSLKLALQRQINDSLSGKATKRSWLWGRAGREFSLDTTGRQDYTKALFEDICADEFHRIRQAAGLSDENFREALCTRPLRTFGTSASKSGSIFWRTEDNVYIFKSIPDFEVECMQDIISDYSQYLDDSPDSLLCRILMMFRVTADEKTTNFMVMKNVLTGSSGKVYDLKGTTEDRWVDPEVYTVLKDNNLASQCFVFSKEDRHHLVRVIRDDAEFLESHGIMDYSLIVGFGNRGDGFRGTLVDEDQSDMDDLEVESVLKMGIVDMLQRWTAKKVAAFWLKKPTIGCCMEIDTEPPAIYCNRFVKYFFRKFTTLESLRGEPSSSESNVR